MIYFMQPTEGGPVKIGFTDDISARYKQLERHYGKPLAILATIDGDLDTEREIHRRFDHLRLDGLGSRGAKIEQFRPAPDLMAFIGRPLLVSPNPEAVESMVPVDFVPGLTSIKFDKTLAGKARLISQGRGVSMAEYLSEMTRATIDRDYAKLMRELEAGPSPRKPTPAASMGLNDDNEIDAPPASKPKRTGGR